MSTYLVFWLTTLLFIILGVLCNVKLFKQHIGRDETLDKTTLDDLSFR